MVTIHFTQIMSLFDCMLLLSNIFSNALFHLISNFSEWLQHVTYKTDNVLAGRFHFNGFFVHLTLNSENQ